MTHVTLESDLIDGERADPGTAEDSTLDRLAPVDARTLYRVWEREHWSADALNFERDRLEWAAVDSDRRAGATEAIAPVLIALEHTAAFFPLLIESAEDEHERAFLTTQRADEVRHRYFFDRVWREVWASDEQVRSAGLAKARARCDESFRDVFDPWARRVVERLRVNPQDIDAKVEAVVMHYLVVKALLGLTAIHFAVNYFERVSILASVCDGLRHVTRDEHRHVAWATWYLRTRCAADPLHHGGLVQTSLHDLLPAVVSIMIDGGMAACEAGDSSEYLGYSAAELNYFALMALLRRLRVIGGETTEIQQLAASGAWRASRMLSVSATSGGARAR
jgi:ribonucleoside-diphosphate reductase beta chain